MKRNNLIIYLFSLTLFILVTIILTNNPYIKVNDFDYQKCSEITYEESLKLHPKNFKSFNLRISFFSERNWRKRILRDKIQSYKNKKESGYHTEFFTLKNRNKATFYFELPNELKCKLVGNVRPHGDFSDHRPFNKIQSLNVNLIDGHIFGITKFLLLRPETRNGDNEILITTIFNQIGFLAPRSSYINFSHKERNEKFIFQERISKEFLENNSLKESALYQGDERFVWWDPYKTLNLSRHKLLNPNWAKKNETTSFISEKALSILNKTNQYYRGNIPQVHVVDYYSLGKKLDNQYFSNLDTFDAIMYSLEAEHGLSRDDRRFYFSAYYQKFLPIYYDGFSKILSNGEVNFSPFYKNEDIIPNKSNLKNGKVTLSSISGSKKATRIINELNIDNLQVILKLRDLDIKKSKLKNIKKNIIFNLKTIENFPSQRLFDVSHDFVKRSFINEMDKINENIPRRLVYYDESYENFLNCNLHAQFCIPLKVDNLKKATLIAQEYKDEDKNHLIYIGKKLGKSVKDGWFIDHSKNKLKKKFNRKKINYEDDLSFEIIGDVTFNIEKKNRNITFSRNNSYSKIVFFEKVKNWTINFEDNSQIDYQLHSLDQNGLSGCLNFIDAIVSEVKLNISNSKCEDAVNFVRTRGNIQNMIINNSFYDGVDADFSNLNFKNFTVVKSGNDCLDFSWGNYIVENSLIKECKDKAISVGESSNLIIKNSVILKSNIGIASKDYSKTTSINNEIQNTKYCYQAYNKKQEFSGGKIISKNTKCKHSDKIFYKDNYSSIKIDL